MGAVYQAARATDTVGHNYGMVGMLVGAAFGVALIVGGVLTGGTLFLVAAVAVAALSGAALAHGIQTIKGSGNPTTGVLGFGSPNVRINGLGAARVMVDFAAPICNGLYGTTHYPLLPMPPIAEGNPTIRINGMLAARIEHKLVCAADITDGSPNVLYGAASEQVLTIIDTEQILSLIGTGILIAAFGIEAAIIGYVVTSVIGDAADKYLGEGWGDIINGTLGFLALGLGVVSSRRSARPGNVRAGETPRTGGYGSRVVDTAPEGVRNFEGRIRSEPLERGQFFDENGQPRSGEIVGSENAIDISKGKGVAGDAIFTHNHPNNGNFSPADLTTATNYNMAEIRATTQNGNTYSMKRGPDGWNVKSPQEMNAIFRANQEMLRNNPEAQRLYREGNHDAVNDMLMEGIARDIGGIYNRH